MSGSPRDARSGRHRIGERGRGRGPRLDRRRAPRGFDVVDREDAVLFAVPRARRDGAPLVVLAGHVDTVPPNGNFPAARDGDAIVGRGAADMKGAIAVMLETASWLAAQPGAATSTSASSSSDARSCRSRRARCCRSSTGARSPGDRPGDRDGAHRERDRGRLPREPQRAGLGARPRGAQRASLAGRNAIHAAISALAPIADLPPSDVEIDGLIFREVVSVTSIEGGIAGNVVPDRVEATVNFRYAPTRTPAEAEARLRELLAIDDAELTVVANAPPGPVVVRNPLVERLRARGRSGGRAEAGVDPGGGVRDGRRGRRQLRTGRPAVRSSGRRARRDAALVRSYAGAAGFLARRRGTS